MAAQPAPQNSSAGAVAGTAGPPLDASERLLLLQAVYREGANGAAAFEAVSRLLLAHPATQGRPRSSLSPAVSCAAMLPHCWSPLWLIQPMHRHASSTTRQSWPPMERTGQRPTAFLDLLLRLLVHAHTCMPIPVHLFQLNFVCRCQKIAM